MEWTKVTIATSSLGAEAVTGILLANNIPGMEIIDPTYGAKFLAETAYTWDYADESLLSADSDDALVVFYTTNDEAGEGVIRNVLNGLAVLRKEFPEAGKLDLTRESADDAAWLNEWKKHFKPFKLGQVVIVPEWEEYIPAEGEITFKIDPGSAFGTGQHQTTQLCIIALREQVKTGNRLLDIGCGSGILSIIGLLLGAFEVLACDIDPASAIAATKKNAQLNHIDVNHLKIFSGDVLSDEALQAEIFKNKYDVVVANIVADVIIGLTPLVPKLLTANGVFIASGIIDERREEVLAAFEKAGIEMLAESQLDGWCCVIGGCNA